MKSIQVITHGNHITVDNSSVFSNLASRWTFLVTLFCLLVSSPARAESPRPTVDLTAFDHADEANGTLVFTSPGDTTPLKPLKTDLAETKYLGTLRPPEGPPYFLFSAKPCKSCQDEQAIFAVRPNDRKPTAFVYPGKILDPKSRGLLLESRAFFGKCLPNREDLYIVFQQERVDRRSRLQASVLVEEAGKDHLNETLIDRHAPKLRTVLQQVKRKVCREIEGRNRLMLSRPLDLHPHSTLEENDDEGENEKDNKESGKETSNDLKGGP